jgi:hypothetical protein
VLNSRPDTSPEALAKSIVENYGAFYKERAPNAMVTQSALRLDRIPDLVSAIGNLADELNTRLSQDTFWGKVIFPVARHVKKFFDAQYVDLGDFCQLLAHQSDDQTLMDAALAVSMHLEPTLADSAVVATQANGADGAKVHGVSIYFPFLGNVSPAYTTLEFSQQCNWGKFLESFGQA